MLIAGVDTIRDVILFPTLRPEEGRDAAADGEGASTSTSARPAEAEPAPADPDADALDRPAARGRSQRDRASCAWLTALLGLASLLPTLPWVHVSLGLGDLLVADRPLLPRSSSPPCSGSG